MTTPAEDDNRHFIFQKLYPRHDGGRNRDELKVVAVRPGEATAYAQAALSDEVTVMTTATEGTRNDTLNRCGFNLAQLVASGHLNHDTAWNALHTAALATGLPEHEVVNTLRSAFRAGGSKPRVVAESSTPYDAPELSTVTLPQPDTEDPPSLADRFPRLNWHDLWADDRKEEWVVEPILPARRLVALFSPPKVGKSLLMLELAVAIARGTPTLGTKLDRPRRVLYVDFENDPRGDVRSRLQAMGLTPDDLENLSYLSYPRLAYLDTNIGGLELLAVAQLYGAEVVVIDTISRAVNGEENDNDTWLAFYRNTGLLLKAEGIAVIRLDHTGKDASKGMRGGSAKYGDVDAVWSMTKVGETAIRLECTANRLPIAEKVLLLERRTDPVLHHAVSTRRTGDVVMDETLAIVDALDRLKFPVVHGRPGPGEGKASALDELDRDGFGHVNDRRLRDALTYRKKRELEQHGMEVDE